MSNDHFTCGVAVGTDLAVDRAVVRAVVRQDGIEIFTKSPFDTEIKHKVFPITVDQYSDWVNGTPIQYAMPDLSADDRELLITGMAW